MAEFVKGAKLVLNDESEVSAYEYLDGKLIGLYFSASWCGPCRLFTPKLKAFYETIKKSHPEFEIVYVSSDKEEADLLEYYEEHHGPWTYLKFGDEWIKTLTQKYEVRSIPAFKIVRPDGTVVVDDAKAEMKKKGDDVEALYEEWKAFNF